MKVSSINLKMRKTMVLIIAIAVAMAYTVIPWNVSKSYADDGGNATNASDMDFDEAPNLKLALCGYDDISLTWSAVSGADGYNIYYQKSTAKHSSLYKSTSDTSITAKNLADGAKYYFKVVPYTTDGTEVCEGTESKVKHICTLKKVSIGRVVKTSSRSVRVYWKNIGGETGYQIARSKHKTKGYSVVKSRDFNYSSAKVKAATNKTYYYKVRAYKKVNGKKIYAPWSKCRKYKILKSTRVKKEDIKTYEERRMEIIHEIDNLDWDF